MKTVILDRKDFKNDGSTAMTFDALLETLEVETHILVNGKIVELEIDSVEITVLSAKAE